MLVGSLVSSLPSVPYPWYPWGASVGSRRNTQPAAVQDNGVDDSTYVLVVVHLNFVSAVQAGILDSRRESKRRKVQTLLLKSIESPLHQRIYSCIS